MEKLGTNYGGWYVPTNMNLNENSIIYSGGVGEDISFDLLLHDKYKSNIFLIDPTKKAINHFSKIKQYYNDKIPFKDGTQSDYFSLIKQLTPNFNKFEYFTPLNI